VATRAERARSERERSGPKRAPKPKKRRTRRPGPHNEATRVAKKATYQEEDRPETTQPSRKSSRRGANHVKFASNLKLRQTNRVHAPSSAVRRSPGR
jgi:hypothetical protein